LSVNRSTYYKHYNKKEVPRDLENQALRSHILTIYSRSKKRLGAYKIRQRLIVEYGKKISIGRIYRLIKAMALPKMSTIKPKVNCRKADVSCMENHLKGDFNPKAPDRVWVSDITYVRISGHFCYICAIMDLFSRKIIAYKTSAKINTNLVLDTFNIAYSRRGCPKGVMFHSDRGSQYTSSEFRQTLDRVDFVQSFSAKCHPFDNAHRQEGRTCGARRSPSANGLSGYGVIL
jgi:transposase InsO family protein